MLVSNRLVFPCCGMRFLLLFDWSCWSFYSKSKGNKAQARCRTGFRKHFSASCMAEDVSRYTLTLLYFTRWKEIIRWSFPLLFHLYDMLRASPTFSCFKVYLKLRMGKWDIHYMYIWYIYDYMICVYMMIHVYMIIWYMSPDWDTELQKFLGREIGKEIC